MSSKRGKVPATAFKSALCAIFLTLLTGCESVVDDRIPAMPVSIDLTGHGTWNTYGVPGYGFFRYFIFYKETREPAGFPYSQYAATGYGGVLLIGGMDPYTGDTNVPLAYDLSCPVECSQTVRVQVSTQDYLATCPVCHSVYNVTERAGAAISGPAVSSKYRLKNYRCIPSAIDGGYLISDR